MSAKTLSLQSSRDSASNNCFLWTEFWGDRNEARYAVELLHCPWIGFFFYHTAYCCYISERNVSIESIRLSTLLYHLWSQHMSVMYKFFILFAVEFRKSLHFKLGLPYDRPLLRIANALDFSKLKYGGSASLQKGIMQISIESSCYKLCRC